MVINFSGGKLWLDELPQKWCYQPEFDLEQIISISSKSVTPRTMTILSAPNGSHGRDGAIGITYTPNNSDRLRIVVGVADNHAMSSAVVTGLIPQFAEAVLKGLKDGAVDTGYVGGGRLEVRCACWHQVDSTQFGFMLLARSLIYLLNPQLLNMDFTNEIVKETIKSARDDFTQNRRKNF